MPRSDQGVIRDRYMLIPRLLIFLWRGETVLLIKGAPSKQLWAGKYNGIGGHVERGEDARQAARRELLEETGLVADVWLCGTILVDTGENPGVGIFVFTGECSEGDPKPSEEGTLEWIPAHEVSRLTAVEDLELIVRRIRGIKPGDPPFSAHSFYDEQQKLVLSFEN